MATINFAARGAGFNPFTEFPFAGLSYEGPFDEFPAKHGYDAFNFVHGDMIGRNEDASAFPPFTQAWLHVGLLIEVLNEGLGLTTDSPDSRLKTSDFVEDRGGMQFICLRNVSDHVQRWFQRTNRSSFQTVGHSIE